MNTPFGSTSAPEAGPRGESPGWYASLGVSTAVHVCLIVALGGLSVAPREGADRPDVDTRWTPREKDLELTRVKPLQTISPSSSEEPTSASRRAARTRRPELVLPTAPRPPLETADVERAVRPEWATAKLSEEVAVRTSVSAEPDADAGSGTGEGGDFFGLHSTGKRFVYVVDRSRSMNHPHPGEAKTRFGRVKLELVRSIGGMSPEREFFIVFFNDEALPMPAERLQPARRPLQKRYLRWAAEVKAKGQTDPRTALQLAVRLEPDVIYFLTDGRFPQATVDAVTRENRGRIAIHTFCIGNQEGEELLKEVAANNGGRYHFVP